MASAHSQAEKQPRCGHGGAVYCAVGVTEYRKVINWLLKADDRVLEIGCQQGLTTSLIVKHIESLRQDTAGQTFVLGVDIYAKSVSGAKKVCLKVEFGA